MKNFFLLLTTSLLFTGCSTITNLTPSQQSRNANGLYPVEAAWDSRQQSIRSSSFQPSVMVGFDSYPMRRTPLMTNRWETLVPVTAGTNVIHYRFKFDYNYNAMRDPRPDSKLSREYRLLISDQPAPK
ncbi:MAG: hypothetical protein ABI042_16005 [Verrucomicrobiota bacterium]